MGLIINFYPPTGSFFVIRIQFILFCNFLVQSYRPILTRPETLKTKQILETAEMKVVLKIAGKTLMDRKRVEDINEHAKQQ